MERLLQRIYFLVVPFILVVISQILPVSGVIINLLITLVIFLSAEVLERRSISGVPLLRLFGRGLRFRDYYARRPPRPFLYYVFYPLLAPYWLWNREARQELLLYRNYTLLGLFLVVFGSVLRYLRFWWPDIPVGEFIPVALASLFFELIVIVLFLMPIATTIVSYKLQGRSRELVGLLLAALVGGGLAVLGMSKWRSARLPAVVVDRAAARDRALPERAGEAKQAALTAAWAALAREPSWRAADGFVLGPPLEEARRALLSTFREEEAACFFLWSPPEASPPLLVIFLDEGKRGQVWLGLDAAGRWLTQEAELPAGALEAMSEAARQ